MKAAFYTLIGIVLFLTVSSKASAQGIPDTSRLALGADLGLPAGDISGRYVAMAGLNIRFDYPLTRRSYLTASISYNTFYLGDGSLTTQQAILNDPLPLLQTAPIKIGYKYFLSKGFYVQAEAGETAILNKASEFATKSWAFTYAPGFGILFKLKQKGTYIDTGFRYEGVSSFYNDTDKYSYWALHVLFSFNL